MATDELLTIELPTGSWIVPVNMSRAAPTTRASTISPASGASGRPNSSLAGTDSCARGCSRAEMPAMPYQTRALTRPVTPVTATAATVPRCAMTAAAADSMTTLPSSHSTERSGGRRRHQATFTPPWLSAIAMPPTIGSAARNGQENGSTATPNASVTVGDSSSHASAVSAMLDQKARLSRGARRSRGQASRSSSVSIADLASSTTAAMPVNQGHDWLSANSQRRSW